MVEKKEQFEGFKFRLRAIGQIIHHDRQWKEIFEKYGFEWKDWWNDYCEGFRFLTSSQEICFGSIFSTEIENLFIKWLYFGKKEDLIPFYEWFCSYMERKRTEEQKAIEINQFSQRNYPGYIYVIKSNNLFKIGRTKNIKERIKDYKTQNPFEIEVIFKKKVNDYVKAENKLLEKFKNKKKKGEWFELTEKDINWIKENV